MVEGKDGTSGKQGNPQGTPGQTPNATPGTSDSTEKTYTEAELQKAISDGKADLGRKVATLTKTVGQLQADRDAATKQLEEQELERVRSDPAQLRAYQSRKALETQTRDLATREAALAQREAEIQERETATKTSSVAVAITRLSAEHGIEASKLTELGIDNVETLEKVAAAWSGKAPAAKPGITRLDSGKTKGGTNLENMNPSEKILHGLEQEKRRRGG